MFRWFEWQKKMIAVPRDAPVMYRLGKFDFLHESKYNTSGD